MGRIDLAIRYLALGDSYTIGTGASDESRSWPAIIAARLNAELTNPAVNGYTTLDLIRHELPLVKGLQPDLVSVLIGVNDLVQGRTPEQYRDSLRTIYEEVATDEHSPFYGVATFGAAEMLRALGRHDEAQEKLSVLLHDEEWATRAQLRSAELYIDKADAPNARRVLEGIQPKSVAEKRERRLLNGRLQLILQRPERAIGTFQGLLKRREGTPHATLIAALFGIADAHLRLKTPEAADDAIEQFVDHHPGDPDSHPAEPPLAAAASPRAAGTAGRGPARSGSPLACGSRGPGRLSGRMRYRSMA